MKAFIVITLSLIASSAFAQNTKGWESWRIQFDQLAKSKGLASGVECTRYVPWQKTEPQRLLYYYFKGFSPAKAFDEMGCDCEVFEQVFKAKVLRIVRAHGIRIATDNDARDEKLWLEFFLEHKSPEAAAQAILSQ